MNFQQIEYPPIEEHGIIGNLETAALIDRGGHLGVSNVNK